MRRVPESQKLGMHYFNTDNNYGIASIEIENDDALATLPFVECVGRVEQGDCRLDDFMKSELNGGSLARLEDYKTAEPRTMRIRPSNGGAKVVDYVRENIAALREGALILCRSCWFTRISRL